MRLLRDAAATPAGARQNAEHFLDALVFNTVVAAPDAHARNLAVLLEADRVLLAPLYDLATGLAYTVGRGQSRSLSMGIGVVTAAEAVDAEAWRRCSDDLEVDEAAVLERVEWIAEGAPEAFAAALDEVNDWDGSVSDLRSRLLPNLQRLRRGGRS
ncbi:MAG: HipA domain-containing protein [Actinomycetota bacterium]